MTFNQIQRSIRKEKFGKSYQYGRYIVEHIPGGKTWIAKDYQTRYRVDVITGRIERIGK